MGIDCVEFGRFDQGVGDGCGLAEQYKRGKAEAIAHVANLLLQKARWGCTTSSIFYLKTPAGWRETAELRHVPFARGGGKRPVGNAALQLLLSSRFAHIASESMRRGAQSKHAVTVCWQELRSYRSKARRNPAT